MSNPIVPAQDSQWRAVLSLNMAGYEIAALQLNLNQPECGNHKLIVDGEFGPLTQAAVKAFQTVRKLPVTGTADYATQRNMAQVFITPIDNKYLLPPGLMSGITQDESGWFLGAVVWHDDKKAVDAGWIQDSTSFALADGNWFTNAFNGSVCFNSTAARLRSIKNTFAKMPGGNTNEAAWKLAILDHNWPAGAYQLAEGTPLPNTPSAWVTAIGVAGVTTEAEWANFYIGKCDVYVKTWTA